MGSTALTLSCLTPDGQNRGGTQTQVVQVVLNDSHCSFLKAEVQSWWCAVGYLAITGRAGLHMAHLQLEIST
jgi:hypothetical protein